MAGSDRSREGAAGGPAVILVRPQMGENIGTAARAMLNFGLTDLRIVQPRDGWPNVKAVNAASGAIAVIDGVRVFDNAAEAIADLSHVFATTARPRDMLKPVTTPRAAVAEMRAWDTAGERSGLLFGRETMGLDNDTLTLADAIIEVPTNPAFASLNLAQAVLLIGYEWLQSEVEPAEPVIRPGHTRPATRAELQTFFDHLESELDACGFLRNKEKRPTMVRNIRNLFLRTGLFEQELRTLHGIVSELSHGRHRRDDDG